MQRAHEVLFYVGLGEARYRNVETYSTGMKQRIKLAQALVHDPDLVFLDEPTNGMTSELRRKLHSVIPIPADGQHEFEEKTGINIETDIDRVVACLNPDRTSSKNGSGMSPKRLVMQRC